MGGSINCVDPDNVNNIEIKLEVWSILQRPDGPSFLVVFKNIT